MSDAHRGCEVGITPGGVHVEVKMPPHIAGVGDVLPNTTATVTAAQRVFRGDMIAMTHELARDGEPLRVAYGSAKLMDATSTCIVDPVRPGANVVIWAFEQDGGLYLKTAQQTGEEWRLGATVYAGELMPDRVVLTYAASYDAPREGQQQYVVLLYESEGRGEGQIFGLSDLVLKKVRDIVWCDETPGNLAACWAPAFRVGDIPQTNPQRRECVSVAYQTEAGEIALVSIDLKEARVHEPVILGAGSHMAQPTKPWMMDAPWEFALAAPDSEEYLSNAWHLQCHREHGTCFLTYPGADGKRYVLEYMSYVAWDNDLNGNRFCAMPGYCRPMILDGYQPCGSGVSNLDGREVRYPTDPVSSNEIAAMPWLVGTIARTAGGNAQKAMLGMERFLGGERHYLTPLGYIETADKPRSNIGLLGCCRCGPYQSAMAVGYESEGKYHTLLVYLQGTLWDSPLMTYSVGNPLFAEPVCGPDVVLADVGEAAMLVEHNMAPVLLYQRDGSIWLQRLSVHDVAATVKAQRLADGVAITGGSPGKTIKVATLRTAGSMEGGDGGG